MSKPFCASGGSVAADSGAHRPYKIGLAGGRGVGKSVATERLTLLGAKVISTDEITHELLDNPGPAYYQVLRRFGANLAPVKDGPIDRDVLAGIVFAAGADAEKADLEAILFPCVNQRIDEIMAGMSEKELAFIEVPLLHEAGMADFFDEVWCITAPEALQVQWVMQRDGVTEPEARNLIRQHGLTQDEKANLSDVVLVNDSTREAFEAKVDAEYRACVKRAEAKRAEAVQAAVDATANDRYRHVFTSLGEIGVAEAVERLGNVARTKHKKATAKLSMDVDSSDGQHPDASRRLEVEVRMEIRNTPGGSGNGGCSCGCGPECRVSCACQPDCGCSCRKPAPPPPTPPDGCDHGCGDCNHRRYPRLWLLVLAFFALLAFLFAVIVLVRQPSQHTDNGGKIVIVTPPCPGTCKGKDSAPPDDSGGVFRPPSAPPPVVKPCKPCDKHVVNEIPEYAFRFTHNAVRVQLRTWEISCGGSCEGATVDGFSEDHQLLVHQEFDKDYWLTYQYVFTYFPDGTTQVDKFEGRQNIFVGRTVYRFNAGLLARAEMYDGMQRLLFTATYSRTSSVPMALSVETFDPTSGARSGKRTVVGVGNMEEYVQENFYAYDRVKP